MIRYFVILLLSLPFIGYAQLSCGGTPYYAGKHENINAIRLAAPDLSTIVLEDEANDAAAYPYRFAINRFTETDILQSGSWEDLSDGRVCRLLIESAGASAISLYFSKYQLAAGTKLFIYSLDHQQVLGAFTSENNQENGLFASSLISGSTVIIEFFEPYVNKTPSKLVLGEISHAYRGINDKGFGGSGACEVNINCPEGNNWKDEKRGVVRIQIKIGVSSFWCTGSLLNNTRQDYKPYILTADHCGMTANASDLSQWIFYFNYESSTCADPLSEPPLKTMVGAKKKACSGGNGIVKESDMYLVLLNNHVPDSYNPYYNGWTLSTTPATSGTCIHHPEGDIKKISTFTNPAYSTNWGSTPNSHWGVKWSATISGHGVTERGSSGSPLFNNQGLFCGQLSGGGSSCSALNEADLFGKLTYSWQPAGSDSSNNLKYWLDPDNTGVTVLPGIGPYIVYVDADFSVSEDTIVAGTSVDFSDLSSGSPISWNWTFTGAEVTKSNEQNPHEVKYPKPGLFPVTLVASNTMSVDTTEKKYFMLVIPNIYPNPFDNYVNIDMGSPVEDDFTIELYDETGRNLYYTTSTIIENQHYIMYIHGHTAGFIYIKFKTGDLELKKKLIRISRKN